MKKDTAVASDDTTHVDEELVRVEEGLSAPHWVTGEQTPYIEIHTAEAQLTVWPGSVYVETVNPNGYSEDNQANIGPQAIEALITAWRKLNPIGGAADAADAADA
jgi:hypothetical protein